MLMITMEVLKPLPKQVVDDLLAGTDVSITATKEERILADYDSVKEVATKTIAGSLILQQILSDELGLEKSRGIEGINMIEDIEKAAVEMFYTGKTPQNLSLLLRRIRTVLNPAVAPVKNHWNLSQQ